MVRQHRVCRAARLSAKLGRRSRPEIRPQAQKLEDLTRKVVPRALPAVGDVIQPVGICLQKLFDLLSEIFRIRRGQNLIVYYADRPSLLGQPDHYLDEVPSLATRAYHPV